ncbi:Presenilin-domain-containing protein [Blastocladiella britannica]|nr:Presenilin-domain-containing protein [Blastocladiella britannica]
MVFYARQVYRLLGPILSCIFLSILWSKISMLSPDFRPGPSVLTVYKESATDTAAQRAAGSFENAGLLLAQIAVMTVLLVVLFKYNCMRLIYGIFGLVMVSVLGLTGYLLTLAVIQVFRIMIDYVTLTFALYNFAAVGIVAIFWKSPRWVQQVYLVLMSSLMAYALTGLQEWTTWILLGLLVLWDLFAVLSPYGPLRALLNTVQQQNQNIEMLVYSVGAIVWFMATPPLPPSSSARAPPLAPPADLSADGSMLGGRGSSESSMGGGGADDDKASLIARSSVTAAAPALLDDTPGPSAVLPASSLGWSMSSSGAARATSPPTRPLSSSLQASATAAASASGTGGAEAPPAPTGTEPAQDEEEEDDDDSGLKLGLGDFVFYSVLTARAAVQDWTTTLACIVAVTSGMAATIFLLAVLRKALPALPISITFGIVFYFGTTYTLSPFMVAVGNGRLVL